MKSPIDMNEAEMRNRFDFSKATRGRFHDRYEKGHTITFLHHNPDHEQSATPSTKDSQLTEIAGKHLLISRLISAGFEVAEPIRDNGIDLLVYGTSKSEQFIAYPIQLKAFSNESFSLDKKYGRIHGLLIAYVWNVQSSAQSDIFALTFDEAFQILTKKGFAETPSWEKGGKYFVRKADSKLKKMLEPYRMTVERWQEKLQAV